MDEVAQVVRGSNPTSAPRLPLSRLEQPGSIPALVLSSGAMAARVLQLNVSLSLYEPRVEIPSHTLARGGPWFEPDLCHSTSRLGLGNRTVSQPSCNLRVAWHLGTERVLQPNDFFHHVCQCSQRMRAFKLSNMTDKQTKCLVFLTGFQSPHDADIRIQLLNQIKRDSKLTILKLTTKSQNLINSKADTVMIEHHQTSRLNKVCKVISKSQTDPREIRHTLLVQ
ncbi:hypothetical protein T265_05826 [Opisthorchis viverrini]|uniref:Uncharacterized protein n=1 Tax=Opisthorchis viverrini TaxID=6198 RepID=A0A074ZMS5_OPIVI|nr:hypothetical protein T265_05826 [Opisthorchis viverrini]KER27067.1 hypothetical protein T265_05826 [Opisthorchis viverrini]